MLQADLQTVPGSAADIMAIDALFKRIAERGRRIRNQSKTADSNNLVGETLSIEQLIFKEQVNKRVSRTET